MTRALELVIHEDRDTLVRGLPDTREGIKIWATVGSCLKSHHPATFAGPVTVESRVDMMSRPCCWTLDWQMMQPFRGTLTVELMLVHAFN